MAEAYIGEIRLFAFNYAPMGWAQCAGQILNIAQNQALFSLLGTQFGGNGTTTFGLPDLRGRVPIGQGQGPGLSNYPFAQKSGAESCTLTAQQIPSHSHTAACTSGDASDGYPNGKVPATTAAASYANPSANEFLANSMIGNAGGGQAHSNMQPYLVGNWCICLEGYYPPRD